MFWEQIKRGSIYEYAKGDSDDFSRVQRILDLTFVVMVLLLGITLYRDLDTECYHRAELKGLLQDHLYVMAEPLR